MARIERSCIINTSAEKVWAAITDIASYPLWFVNLKAIRGTEPPRVGAVWTWDFDMAGIFPMEGTTTYTHVEPSVLLKSDNGGPVPSKWEWHVAPQESGTRLTVIIEYTLPGSLAGRVVDRLFVEPQNERDCERSLAQLKALLGQALSVNPAT